MKVGDKVEILNANCAGVEVGDIGTITQVVFNARENRNEFGVKADLSRSDYNKGATWWFHEEHLKLKENKMKVGFLMVGGSLTLMYNGLTKTIAKGDERFEKVLAAKRAGRDADIPEIVDPTMAFKKAGIEVEEGLLKVKGMSMPPELNSRILEYKSKNIPFTSLAKFWDKLQQNPSYHTRQMLFNFLQNQGHSITEEGDFIGYRGVRDDFFDKHSGTFNNAPGQVCKMPREMVNDDHTQSCSAGLHVGGFEYAKSFGPKLVMVKVNPKDVVAVPDAYAGNKLRVCEFEVLAETQVALQEPVVSRKGTKIEKFEDDDAPQAVGKPLKGEALRLFNESEKLSKASRTMVKAFDKGTPAQKRKHKARYANNHAKRDKTGKFTAKKRK